MKLADLEIIITAPPAPGWGGRYWIIPKLTTTDGIVGYGECYASSVGPDAMQGVIRDVFERHMEGENPENIELMFRRVYSSGFTQRPDLTVIGAWSGFALNVQLTLGSGSLSGSEKVVSAKPLIAAKIMKAPCNFSLEKSISPLSPSPDRGACRKWRNRYQQ